jgi:hypothetical protein
MTRSPQTGHLLGLRFTLIILGRSSILIYYLKRYCKIAMRIKPAIIIHRLTFIPFAIWIEFFSCDTFKSSMALIRELDVAVITDDNFSLIEFEFSEILFPNSSTTWFCLDISSEREVLV